MQTPFLAAINQLCSEKHLAPDKVLEAVQAAIKAAYRKDYGNRSQNLEVELNEATGAATVYLIKDVVKKAELENNQAQIALEDALQFKKDAQVGDVIKIDVTPLDYGRIAAQSAKQVILQRLQEAERDMIYDTYKDREDELLTARVHRVEGDQVFLQLDKMIALLPAEERIPNEKYYHGQHITVYLEKVLQSAKGPQLLISRAHPKLVQKLLERDIPEIKNNVVQIKTIAREPGIRTKLGLASTDPKVDPIGACVGQKGVRIQGVTEELSGERIDVLEYSDDPEKFLVTALAPGKISFIKLDHEKKRAGIYVTEDQRAMTIGKSGQNVRLASTLTGWEIDILTVTPDMQPTDATPVMSVKPEAREKKIVATEAKAPQSKPMPIVSAEKSLIDLKNLPPEILQKLTNAGFATVDQIADLPVEALIAIPEVSKDEAELIKLALEEK